MKVFEGGFENVEADFRPTDRPDHLPVVAVMAVRLHSVAHSRLKESDRIATVATELDVEVVEQENGLVINSASNIK